MNKLQMAEQFRKALQMFAASLDAKQALEIATIYPVWEVGQMYYAGEYLTHGTNSVGDVQLYKVLQDHISQANWLPRENLSLYEPIGLDDGGYPIWSKSSGAHDAYKKGDIVNYDGTLYVSIIDGNIWSPIEYPSGWEVYK